MVTIKDVAKKAGVSTATISRVLNNRGPLSDKTVEKVNRAMEELGYRPNSLARSLVKGLSTCIGVILHPLTQPYWADVANELERYASSMGYTLMITVTSDDVELYKQKYNSIAASRPLGIITAYINDTEEFIAKSSIPTVFWGNTNFTPSVSSDDYQGGILATRHLIAKGCKRLVHIGGYLKGRSSGNARSFAFIEECEKAGIEYKLYEVSERSNLILEYEQTISKVFYENTDMDGIFASNDIIAAHCINMAYSMGYAIPEDIKIVGYDDVSFCTLMHPELTTVHQYIDKMAEIVLSALFDMAEGKTVPQKQVIPVSLIDRKTT